MAGGVGFGKGVFEGITHGLGPLLKLFSRFGDFSGEYCWHMLISQSTEKMIFKSKASVMSSRGRNMIDSWVYAVDGRALLGCIGKGAKH
jgi:hypothetical protein